MIKKIKYIFKPRVLLSYGISKIFFNYQNPHYFNSFYKFAKKYVSFYQGDENGDRATNGGWRWLKEYVATEKPKVIFDVGGYTAEYSLKILTHSPDVQLYVFEPNSESFEHKLKPALTGKGKNVRLINAGLSDHSGITTLYINRERGATDSLHQVVDGKYNHTDQMKVTLSTVDEFCTQEGIEQVDLLKIDTEGNDLSVLKGAIKMLSENRIKTIQFEFGLHYTYSHVYFRDFADFLGGFGYAIYKIMPTKLRLVENFESERTLYSYFVAKI